MIKIPKNAHPLEMTSENSSPLVRWQNFKLNFISKFWPLIIKYIEAQAQNRSLHTEVQTLRRPTLRDETRKIFFKRIFIIGGTF